jgi:hypothetical protein
MVRVGGGWDTLENYLNKHDPCRCPSDIYGKLAIFFSFFIFYTNIYFSIAKQRTCVTF